MTHPEYPTLAEKEYGRGYGTEDPNRKLFEYMFAIGKAFPEVIFAYYYFDSDFRELTIFTFSGDKILKTDKVDFENFKVGEHKMCFGVRFYSFYIDGCFSRFIDSNYGHPFEYKYKASPD